MLHINVSLAIYTEHMKDYKYMKSKWFDYKEDVINLRKKGVSMTVIEREFGIPRSTLSGWLKNVPLTEAQRTKLMKNKHDGWKKARENAVISKNIAKAKRLNHAKKQALDTFSSLPKESLAVLELALAMLYLGEGAKNHSTSLGNSDANILRFFLSSLEKLYELDRNNFRYDLHLRHDQDENLMRNYWAESLHVSPEKINYIVKDERTIGRPTRDDYKGVCLVNVRDISIQRRLKALYTIYCSKGL